MLRPTRQFRICLLLATTLLLGACRSQADPAVLGERRVPDTSRQEGCAVQTARTLDLFEAALAQGWRSYQPLCQLVGPPDWETGSGQSILIYELDDGSEVVLRYGGTELLGAEWVNDGETVNLLGGENNGG